MSLEYDHEGAVLQILRERLAIRVQEKPRNYDISPRHFVISLVLLSPGGKTGGSPLPEEVISSEYLTVET